MLTKVFYLNDHASQKAVSKGCQYRNIDDPIGHSDSATFLDSSRPKTCMHYLTHVYWGKHGGDD